MQFRKTTVVLAVLVSCVVVRPVHADLPQAAANVKQIIAHRGSSADRPENTLAAYRRAIEVGATAVEADVRTTKDGKLVSLHDATLERTTNGKGRIGEISLLELKKLDAGSWFDPKFKNERVPTLNEILRLCRGKIDVLLDLKERNEQFAKRVAEEVRAFGDPRKTIVGVRSVEQAKRFRKLLPQARQIGLIPNPDAIEDFAAAGVETIRLWPKWVKENPLLPARVRKAKLKLHLNGATGRRDEVLDRLKHRPDSLSSDDPGQLVKTLQNLRR